MRTDAPDSEVKQSLFIFVAANGTWEFVALRDGGCALLLDGESVATGDCTEPSVERVLGEFMRVAGTRRATHARGTTAEGHAA